MLPLLLALILQPAPAPAVIPPNAAYALTWNSPGEPGVAFRLYIDGAVVKNYAAAEVTKSATTTTGSDGVPMFSFSAPGMPIAAAGPHTLVLAAYLPCVPAGASALVECESKSGPLGALSAAISGPAAPTGLTIKIIATVTVQVGGGA